MQLVDHKFGTSQSTKLSKPEFANTQAHHSGKLSEMRVYFHNKNYPTDFSAHKYPPYTLACKGINNPVYRKLKSNFHVSIATNTRTFEQDSYVTVLSDSLVRGDRGKEGVANLATLVTNRVTLD